MVIFWMGLASVVIAMGLIVARARRRSQNLAQGIASVMRQLDAPGCTVNVATAHPLTNHMIKEFAQQRGYRYLGRAHSKGLGSLRFARPGSGTTHV